MLINLKPQLNKETVCGLLSSAMFPDAEEIRRAIAQYETGSELGLMGFEKEGEIIAVIGYRVMGDRTLDIRHIAVLPDERGMGYGRGIILHLLELEKPEKVVAETDEDAVDFYRSIGFTIESLGEKYSGIERFKCTFITDFE